MHLGLERERKSECKCECSLEVRAMVTYLGSRSMEEPRNVVSYATRGIEGTGGCVEGHLKWC